MGSPASGSRSQGMDDLADCFAGAFTVTNTPNDTNRPHPRFAQYKMKGREGMNQVRVKKAKTLVIKTFYRFPAGVAEEKTSRISEIQER